MLHEWFELVLEKNKLMRYESELLIMYVKTSISADDGEGTGEKCTRVTPERLTASCSLRLLWNKRTQSSYNLV